MQQIMKNLFGIVTLSYRFNNIFIYHTESNKKPFGVGKFAGTARGKRVKDSRVEEEKIRHETIRK